jgi:hypothetical protein
VDSLEGVYSGFELLVLGRESIDQRMGRTYLRRRRRGIVYELRTLGQLLHEPSSYVDILGDTFWADITESLPVH